MNAMYDQLIENLDRMLSLDMKETSNFKAICRFRGLMVDKGMPEDVAGQYAMTAEVSITIDLTDEEITGLMDPMAQMARDLYFNFLNAGFAKDQLMDLGKQLSLTLED